MVKWAKDLGLAVLLSHAMLLTTAAFGADLEDILKKTDDVRNPSDSFAMTVRVVSTDNDDAFVFQVSINGPDKTLMETMKPAASAGKKYLMLNENMWAFTPKMGHPARISLSQKLTGMAANGDISRTRWHGDYKPVLEKDDQQKWQLLLTATKPDLTYDKIRVWVNKADYHPLNAEFLTPKGLVLKTVKYGAYKALLGTDRPTEIVITDAHNDKQRSTITVLDMKNRSFPAALFNQNALK